MSPRRILAPICRLLGHRFAESTPAPYVDRCRRCGAWVWGESMTAVLAMLAPHDGPEAPESTTVSGVDATDGMPESTPTTPTTTPPDPEVSP